MNVESIGPVSVIIPARNEEANIERAVRSVILQAGVLEILVVDDQSQDHTGGILTRLAKEFPWLKTIRIESLPAGWLGKNYALATGARAARGDWLLFTDADTEHHSGSLEALLDRAMAEEADLLSISPAQKTTRWWEKAVIPMVYARLAGLYRFDEVSDPLSPAAAANGQYLLIRRETYQRVGGHEAVRGEILEDVELARRVKASGGRLIFLPGAAYVETRMFQSFRDLWEGWTKNLFLLYRRKLGLLIAAALEVMLLDSAPFLVFAVLCLDAVFGSGGSQVLPFGVLFLSVAGLRDWQYRRRLRRLGFEQELANYLVLGGAIYGLLLINSALAHKVARNIRWKGRRIETERFE